MNNYTWLTQDGYFSTEKMCFIDSPEDYIALYMDTTDPINPILSDINFLKKTLVFYGFTIPFGLMTQDEQIKEIKKAIQYSLDSFVQTRDYYDMASACSYGCSTKPETLAEAEYAIEARDNTFEAYYAIVNAVKAGERPMPTPEEAVSEMPPLAWPE